MDYNLLTIFMYYDPQAIPDLDRESLFKLTHVSFAMSSSSFKNIPDFCHKRFRIQLVLSLHQPKVSHFSTWFCFLLVENEIWKAESGGWVRSIKIPLFICKLGCVLVVNLQEFFLHSGSKLLIKYIVCKHFLPFCEFLFHCQ